MKQVNLTTKCWICGKEINTGDLCEKCLSERKKSEAAAKTKQANFNAARQAAKNAKKSQSKTYNRSWHTAPDGTPCCCTDENRRHGVGCR